MNRMLFILLAAMAASPFIWQHVMKSPFVVKPCNAAAQKKQETKIAELKRLQSFANKLESYATENGYNNRYCFLIDMTINCGSYRFFVYDLQNDTVLHSGLVTHGYGNSNYYNISFSNIPGSNATSQGKYKIGQSYTGKFGLAYKLYGLDKTNSNAFNRFVVLHAHDCVPSAEVAPLPICMSQGCPTVAPSFLETLSGYLDNAEKPLLLWILN